MKFLKNCFRNLVNRHRFVFMADFEDSDQTSYTQKMKKGVEGAQKDFQSTVEEGLENMKQGTRTMTVGEITEAKNDAIDGLLRERNRIVQAINGKVYMDEGHVRQNKEGISGAALRLAVETQSSVKEAADEAARAINKAAAEYIKKHEKIVDYTQACAQWAVLQQNEITTVDSPSSDDLETALLNRSFRGVPLDVMEKHVQGGESLMQNLDTIKNSIGKILDNLSDLDPDLKSVIEAKLASVEMRIASLKPHLEWAHVWTLCQKQNFRQLIKSLDLQEVEEGKGTWSDHYIAKLQNAFEDGGQGMSHALKNLTSFVERGQTLMGQLESIRNKTQYILTLLPSNHPMRKNVQATYDHANEKLAYITPNLEAGKKELAHWTPQNILSLLDDAMKKEAKRKQESDDAGREYRKAQKDATKTAPQVETLRQAYVAAMGDLGREQRLVRALKPLVTMPAGSMQQDGHMTVDGEVFDAEQGTPEVDGDDSQVGA